MIRLETTLRPRAFGEILDVALESLRQDLPVIATASLLVNAPLAATIMALLYGVTVLGRATAGYVLPLSALAAALVLARPLAQAAIAIALRTRIEAGRAPTLREACGGALRRGLSIAFAGFMFWFALLFGGLLYVIPGLFFAAWCALGVPAAALEGKGPFESLARSGRLLKGHTGRSMGLLIVFGAIYVMLAANAFAAIQGVLYLGRVLLGLRTAYYDAVLTIENGLFATAVLLAVYIVVEPWKACAIYHLHLDARVRYEALDLVGAVERLPAPAPAPAPAGAPAA